MSDLESSTPPVVSVGRHLMANLVFWPQYSGLFTITHAAPGLHWNLDGAPSRMADVFVTLLKAYRRHGFQIRTGLNPLYFGDPDAAFTRLFRDNGTPVNVGGGIALQEIHFLECLFETGLQPKNILIIGNAFGWSATALALLLPDATVVAMDAGLEGEAARVGADLTQTIAAEERVDVRVVEAFTPHDVARVVAAQFGATARVDFTLIDGLHTNEQLLRDFSAVASRATPDCVFALHDVLSWHMLDAFHRLDAGPGRERRILTRCPSGMGLVFPRTTEPSTREVIDAFCDDTVDLTAFHHAMGASPEDPGPTLVDRLAPCWRSRRVAMAGMYESEGEADLGEQQIALALHEGAGDAKALSQIATCLIELGRWQDAEVALRAVPDLAPTWEVPLHQLGCVMREMGRLDEARGHLEKAATLRPGWAPPVFDLGLVMRALERDAESVPYFERASRLDPTWAVPVLELGLVIQRLDGDAAAAEHVERASQLDPAWAQPLCELGAIKFHLGDDAAAIGYLERCLALDPAIAAAHHLLGLAVGRHVGPLAALPALERAVALEPRCAFSHFDLGLVRRSLHDYRAALQHLTHATTLAPDWAPGWIEAALSATHVRQWSQAAALLAKAAELGPTDPGLWNDIAVSSAQAGDWADALAAFRHVRRLVPESRSPEKDIAICLRELDRFAESEEVLLREVEAQPDWAGAYFELGRTCEARQAWARAEWAFERAIKLRPGWQQARDALDNLHQRKAA